jgi:hypothetical protein
MSLLKGQLVHLALLGVAGVLALGVWTRDDDAQLALKPSEVEVWGGSPESVSALSFETATRKLRIEPKKDERGRWYIGTVDKEEASLVHPPPGVDGGAPPNPAKHETIRFLSVKSADDLIKSLAPLHALRRRRPAGPGRSRRTPRRVEPWVEAAGLGSPTRYSRCRWQASG